MNLNELPKPRVLVLIENAALKKKLSWISSQAPTVKWIEGVHEVDPNEWDLLITDTSCVNQQLRSGGYAYTYVVPPILNVLRLIPQNNGYLNEVVDVAADTESGRPLQKSKITLVGDIPGESVALGKALEGQFNSLVKRELSQAIRTMKKQSGISDYEGPKTIAEIGGLETIAVGPQGIAYAAIYRRSQASLNVILPSYVEDLQSWIQLTFRVFESFDPNRFPSISEWFTSEEWMTNREIEVVAQIRQEENAFKKLKHSHDARIAQLEAQLHQERETANRTIRILLNGSEAELQNAVYDSLVELGFEVEDMDETWPPGGRLEDFRLRDVLDDNWICIADATGTKRGVQSNKLLSLGGFVEKYVLKNKPDELPSRWLIANHFFEVEPTSRPKELIRDLEIPVLQANKGLVLDTVALFELVLFVRNHPTSKEKIRSYLRSTFGQINLWEAREFMESMESI